jgi:hypothetical protein
MTLSSEMWTGSGEKDDVIVPLEAAENAAHPIADRRYFEHWYFDAKLRDGHVVVGFVQTSELVRRKPGVEMHVYKPDGEKLSIVRSYSKADVRASEKACDVEIGGNRCSSEFPSEGFPVHRLHLAEEDMEFDLEFRNLLPGWKPGVGKAVYSDREFFAWIVPAPRAEVSGTVRFGDTILSAEGTGYHDHNWGVGDMKRIIDHWYWGRIYTDEFTLLYASVNTRKGYDLITKPLMLARGEEIVLSTGEMELTSGERVFNKAGNRDYPASLDIRVPGRVELRLDVREVIDAHDFIADVPVLRSRPVKPLVNGILGRPGYFRFDSDFSLRVELDGRSYGSTGRTLHEMVALR